MKVQTFCNLLRSDTHHLCIILQQTVLKVCPTFRCPDGLCKDMNTKRKGSLNSAKKLPTIPLTQS